MSDFKSVLTFKSYKTTLIHFEINPAFESGRDVEIEVQFKVNFEYENDGVAVQLGCMLFDENYTEKNYPYFLVVELKGTFKIDTNENLELRKKLFEQNTVAILFPYLRSLITTITANAFVEPVVLPPVNINKLIEEQQNTQD